MYIEEVLEAGRVMRYHAAPIDKKQSVAEHSWGVVIIILKLWPESSRALLVHAALHDTAELRTGDVPSPVKRSSMLRSIYEALEEEALEDMDIHLPFITTAERRQLKIADNLEGMLYCCTRIEAGDTKAYDVRDTYKEYLTALNFDYVGMKDVSE